MIDTHCHVADTQFDADREAAIERARGAGLTTLIEIAESPETWDAAVALADRYPFVHAALGIHPHHAHEAGPDRWPELQKKMRALLAHPKVVAIGEFGLDYFRMQNTREQQDFIFREQLKLARELGFPIVIHCREAERPTNDRPTGDGQTGFSAHADLQQTLSEFYPETSLAMESPRPPGVIHCFSGTWADAQAYLMRGFMLGIDGPVTYPSAKLLQQNVLRLPLERIVLETDSPYLPPQTHRGQRNEPSYLPAVADAIAFIKRKSLTDVAERTSRNARALFRLQ